jgi:hypothetical protein
MDATGDAMGLFMRLGLAGCEGGGDTGGGPYPEKETADGRRTSVV